MGNHIFSLFYRITPILICLTGTEISELIKVRRVHYGKMGKAPTTHCLLILYLELRDVLLWLLCSWLPDNPMLLLQSREYFATHSKKNKKQHKFENWIEKILGCIWDASNPHQCRVGHGFCVLSNFDLVGVRDEEQMYRTLKYWDVFGRIMDSVKFICPSSY